MKKEKKKVDYLRRVIQKVWIIERLTLCFKGVSFSCMGIFFSFSFLLPDYMVVSSISQSTEQARWVFFTEMAVEELNVFSCSDRTVCTFMCFLVYSFLRKNYFTKTYFTLRMFLRPILLFLPHNFKCQNSKPFFC